MVSTFTGEWVTLGQSAVPGRFGDLSLSYVQHELIRSLSGRLQLHMLSFRDLFLASCGCKSSRAEGVAL